MIWKEMMNIKLQGSFYRNIAIIKFNGALTDRSIHAKR